MGQRKAFNIFIDVFSLVVFTAMISTGLLLKFVLPPGSGRLEKLLAGGRHKSIDIYLGLSRHEWGEIHLYISLCFLILLMVHLFLHWSWIKGTFWGTKEKPRSLKAKIAVLGMIALIAAILLAPWLSEPRKLTRQEYLMMQEQR